MPSSACVPVTSSVSQATGGEAQAATAPTWSPGRRCGVQIAKQELVRLLRTEGDNDTADKVDSSLPDEIDTDGDADQLASVGLDRSSLQAKLAGGSLGGTVAP